MSSVQSLREFIGERLTAAAEEIFTHVEETIVQLEAELERQRRLLDIVLQPHMQLQTAGLPHTYLRNQEEAELQQIKEQEEEICISQDEEQPGLKEEANSLMERHFYEGNNLSEEDLHSQQFQAQSFNAGQDEEDHQQASTTDGDSQSREDTGSMCHVSGRQSHPDLENMSEVRYHGENPFNKRAPTKRRPRSQNVRRHSCKECGKTFKTPHCLAHHRRTHTGEKPFCCKVCAKSFHLSSSLKNHMMIHTGARPFSCAECGKRFSRTSTLKTHMATHTGVRPFSCQECGKRFGRASTLKSHMISHTGAKPFYCSLCAKSFTRSFHLKCHMRTHRGEAALL